MAVVLMAALLSVGCAHTTPANDGAATTEALDLDKDGEGTPAPSLEGGSAWLNTDKPLTLEQLRGHVVVLDFWTYCCINCLHVLPELERVERRFAGKPVVVIGVHSGKFDAEKDAQRIKGAMDRHGVRHPVVVDSEFKIWKKYGVRAWPTLVVIDPDGDVVGTSSGEPRPGALGELIDAMLTMYGKHGRLAKQPIKINTPPPIDTGPMRFPGKVAVSSRGDIAIADSGHHRIVISDAGGAVTHTIGSGIAGSADGAFERSAFRYPQGIVWNDAGDKLYVADTENHQLRLIDMAAAKVSTISDEELRSPWALALDGDTLWVAMAGTHQIWKMSLHQGTIEPYAGTGREHIDDGPVLTATFSQPSGLALSDGKLYVADSEVSAIRLIDLRANSVSTLVGTGLFDFGDKDGRGKKAQLQHALGVALRGGQLYIADTFNNKLKRLDPATLDVTTVAEGLSEPGGLAVTQDGRLLVADTNRHRIVTFDPTTGVVSDFALSGLTAPAAAGLILVDAESASGGDAVDEKPIAVRAKGTLGRGAGTLLIDIAPPPGGKLTDGAPIHVTLNGKKTRAKYAKGVLPLRLPITIAEGAESASADVELSYYWCTSGDAAACIPVHANLAIELPLEAGKQGGEVMVTHAVR